MQARFGPMWASAPTKGLQEAWEKNPPVTASPCQPPLGKGTKGTGVADCHGQFANWLRNDTFSRSAVGFFVVRRGGALPLPRATARVAPTEVRQESACEESPSHGFAVPVPFRQGAKGTGDADCHGQFANWPRNDRFLQEVRWAGRWGQRSLRDHFGFIYIGKFIFPGQKRNIYEYII